ncbi:MAG: hypothetical protein R2742_04190 [Micropruina glycogenica]
MYDELGILATADPSGEVVTDLRPLAEQVARDLYLSRYAFDERQPPFALHDLKRDGVTTTGALSLADAALQHSLRPIVPAEAEGMIGQRVEFAEQRGRRRTTPTSGHVHVRRPADSTARRARRPGHRARGVPTVA